MPYIGQTSTPFDIRNYNQNTDISKQKSGKAEQENQITHFGKHGIDDIEISILKIAPSKKIILICKGTMMSNYETVYPYALSVKFDQNSITDYLKFHSIK